MDSEEIKAECDLMYQRIAKSEKRLKELREFCKHEKTFEGNYSWRVGSITSETICSFCGEVITKNPAFTTTERRD